MENNFPFPVIPKQGGNGKLISFLSFETGAGASTLACLSTKIANKHLIKSNEADVIPLVDLNPNSKVRSYLGLTSDVCPASILDTLGLTEPRQILNTAVECQDNLFVIPGMIRSMDTSQLNTKLCLKIGTYLKQTVSNSIVVMPSVYSTGWILALLSDLIIVTAPH